MVNKYSRDLAENSLSSRGFEPTDAAVEAIAREADVCTRTVLRALAGLPIRGRSGVRAHDAIAKFTARARSSAQTG